MASRKLSTAELLRRVDGGDAYADIANDYGITRQAVYNRLRKLRHKTTRAVVAKKVEQVVDQKIDAVGQLNTINQKALSLLDEAEHDPELTLKCMSEIRQQLRLQLEIFSTLYDMKSVQEFQDEVLDVIGKVDPHARNEIIRRLNKKRSIRSAVRYS